jgi:hypothetical protein
MITVWVNNAMVACHTRAHRPGQWVTNLDHLPPELTAFLRHTPQWCREEARKVGPYCHEFVAVLLDDRVVSRLRAAQGVLSLRKKYGAVRLEDACRRAVAYEASQYHVVKRILEQGLDQRPMHEVEGGQLSLAFVDAPRFARDVRDLFRRN